MPHPSRLHTRRGDHPPPALLKPDPSLKGLVRIRYESGIVGSEIDGRTPLDGSTCPPPSALAPGPLLLADRAPGMALTIEIVANRKLAPACSER